MIVMRVVVIHADAVTGASTGLIGLLGDSRVQLVDVSDEARVNTFFNLAEECEPYGLITIRQDYRRDSAKLIHQKLETLSTVNLSLREYSPGYVQSSCSDYVPKCAIVWALLLRLWECERQGESSKISESLPGDSGEDLNHEARYSSTVEVLTQRILPWLHF
ncbi:hypothetical protein BGW36DRAFT_65628 [Talaromyces proteolyticus]|uniref:Uncharacterized protein n=1 Tax=Talaromyces proteolyticus TaxID=1131652 RepID=A0AAD4KET8_9EURO|nr:uncharacterized protein BGW36DRAFT_65628 [Talaromyces proteolyticus]KAH8689969.1 hypothetical protein BGW36DRAFT_65628 [Talaromyces proteolyticus]